MSEEINNWRRFLTPLALSVGAVWFISKLGPGFGSGREVVEYFVMYGKSSFWLPPLTLFITGIFYMVVLEFARVYRVHDYREFCNRLYSPYEKIGSNVYEASILINFLVLGGVIISVGATVFVEMLGILYLLACFIMALFMILLAIFGAKLVRIASSAMTFVALGSMLLLGFLCLTTATPAIKEAYSTVPTLPGKAWKGFVYAVMQTGYLAPLVSVSKPLQTRRSVVLASMSGFIMNGIIIAIMAILFVAYFPNINPVTVPWYYVFDYQGRALWMYVLYSVVLIIACVSSGATVIFSIITRFERIWIPSSNNMWKSLRLRRAAIAVVTIGICMGIAQVGLIALIAKGYYYLALAGLFIIFIPVLTIGIYKVHKKYKELPDGAKTVIEVKEWDR